MLEKIIRFSIKNKLIIGLGTLTLVFLGIWNFLSLPIDAVPDITNNQVQVITQAPSYGANDIERLVTFPIEQVNSNISGLKEIRSFSRFGLSLVTIVFNDDVDIYWARQQVAEKLQQIQSQIPPEIGIPELGPISSGLGEIYQYVVKPKKGYEKKYDAIELRTIQDWIVKRQLIGVKGVAEVSSFGGKLKQYQVLVDPDKLNAMGLTINDVFNALNNNNQNTGGGYLEKGGAVLYVRSEGLLQSMDDIKSIPITKHDYPYPIYMRDVAEISIGFATRYGAMCYNADGEVSGGIVMMLKGENSSEVIKDVKDKIKLIQKTLPEGVEIEPFLDRTKMVNNAIKTVRTNLIEGALIVILILVVFLGNLRAGLLVASVIPLSLLFAIIMMNLFGVSGNLMSLGALDFGLIVDGAVIIVEAVLHQLHRQNAYSGLLSHHEMDHLVEKSSKKMMNSAVFGQLIILIVYLPIFSLEGIEGKMFKPMAQTVSFALLGAFILSLTYVPMMSSLTLSKKKIKTNISDRLMEKIELFYQKTLVQVLRRSGMMLTAVIVVFGFSIYVLSNLGGEFIPELEEGDFAVDTRVLTGSNLNTTIEYTQKTAQILKSKFPEIEKIVTKIGSGEVPTDPMPMEASDMMIILKDKEEWTSAKTFTELADKMGAEINSVIGVTAGFQFPVQMRFNELMTGARQDVVCKIFGENIDTLSKLATRLGNTIGGIKGAKNLYVEPVIGSQQISIEFNRPMLSQYKLSINEVNRIINTAFSGQAAGQIFEDERRFDLVVKLKSERKKDFEDVYNLLIPTKSGIQIPLHQIARVEIKNGINQIQREEARRRIIVGFNIEGRDIQSIVDELNDKVNAELKLPSGYYIKYGGTFENLQQAKERLKFAVPISLLLIFLLLYFAFNSVKQGILIFTSIPLSAIGGILFLALRDMPFSISAGIGFIALFGVAVLNGIVLISEFNRIKSSNIGNNLRVVMSGTKVRLRPVLMTAFVASLGFLPMALSNGAGAEVQRPLATVVIGGLLVATLLTLFVLPILYIKFEKIQIKRPKIKSVSLLIFLSMSVLLSAQSTLNLEKSIIHAQLNNPVLKSEMLRVKSQEVLVGSFFDLPGLNISSDIGQINSTYFDSKFSVSQEFSLPSYYNRRKNVLLKEVASSKANFAIKKYELEKEMTKVYYEYQILKKKEKLFEDFDVMLTDLLDKVNLRLNKGEINLLEKSFIESEIKLIKHQKIEVRGLVNASELQFHLLMDSDSLTPEIDTFLSMLKVDTLPLMTHPIITYLEAKTESSISYIDLAKESLKPSFSIGYANTSFRGIGPDNNTYEAADRFSAVQLSVFLPLNRKAIQSKISASKIEAETVKTDKDFVIRKMQKTLKSKVEEYEKLKTSFLEFEGISKQNNLILRNLALQQYNSGDINFLELVYLLKTNFQNENSVLDKLSELNKAAMEINYLIN